MTLFFLANQLILPTQAQAQTHSPQTVGTEPCVRHSGASDGVNPACIVGAPRYALVVGEVQYQAPPRYVGEDWRPLDIAHRDAEAMARQLSASGFGLVGGGAQFDLSRARFMEALSQLSGLARSRGAITLVYISGHGFTDHGQTYVSPVEAPRPILGVTLVSARYLSVRDIQAALSPTNPALQIIVIDACRDALPSYGPISGDQDPLGRNSVLGLAAEPGATVPVDPNARLSAYTSALIDSLRSMTSESTLVALLLDAAAAVSELSGGSQVPVFRSGDPDAIGRLRAAAVFGASRTALAPADRIAADQAIFRLIPRIFDYALSCDFTGRNGRTPISEEERQFFGVFLLQASSAADLTTKCGQMSDQVERESRTMPDTVQRQLDARMSSGSMSLLKQIAQQGNAHANLLIFAAVFNRTDLLFARDGPFRGYLSPGDRTALEYAFRAADAGDPMAELLIGQINMPYVTDGKFFAVLPGDIAERYEQGRTYLERALSHGMGDAGLILAHNADLHLQGLNTHPELYRSYVERSVSARMLIFPAGYVQAAKYELAIDCLHGNTGPKDPVRGSALLREIVGSPIDNSEELGASVRGLAAWRLVFDLTRRVRPTGPADRPEFQEIRRLADIAANLGIKEAELFVGKVRVRGWFGYPQDPVLGEAMLRRAATSTATSGFEIHFPGE